MQERWLQRDVTGGNNAYLSLSAPPCPLTPVLCHCDGISWTMLAESSIQDVGGCLQEPGCEALAEGSFDTLLEWIFVLLYELLHAQSCGLFLAKNSCEKGILRPELGASLKITLR